MHHFLNIAKLLFACGLLLLVMPANAQAQTGKKLEPGFIANEYADMLWLAFYGFADSLQKQDDFPLKAGNYKRLLRTPEVGLKNRAEIYLRSDSVIILSLRGTVPDPQSWLANFYAGMVPATGQMQLTSDYNFSYQLAEREDALVHVGWTLSTGFLAREYLPVLEGLLNRGLHQIIVTGHSQGGALSFLNTSLVHYMFRSKFPNLRLKTYASAAPKPGNQYYAYDFEHITGVGYHYRIVNTEDWVPETPITVQGLNDFNKVNPFVGAKDAISNRKFPERVALNYMYKSMRNGSAKAAKRYRKFLGNGVGKVVQKSLPGYVAPNYSTGSLYATAGAPVILSPTDAYRQKFVYDGSNVFVHHMYAPYFFLLQQGFQMQTTGAGGR